MNREQLLEKWGKPVPVLDHGFIQLVDVMGDDRAVLQAARTSTNASSKGDEADRKLLRYLFRHKHATPFEACNIKVIVKLPIFVERQWVRHRASWLNEVSARYTQLPEEFYVPDPAVRPMAQSKSNKQGSEGGLEPEVVDDFIQTLRAKSEHQYVNYSNAVGQGVAKEVSRLHMTVNQYTKKVWGSSLRMLLHFLGLRKHAHAQWEIRQYADVLFEMVQDWCPWTCEAFEDYELGAHTFSRMEMEALRELVGALNAFTSSRGTKNVRNVLVEGGFDQFGIETTRERKAFLDALGVSK